MPEPWRPNKGPQERFLALTCYEAMYGGAAGGGKSEALLMAVTRHVRHPKFRALLLRNSFPELHRSLIERSRSWYPYLGGRYNESSKVWRFPSGSIIEFGYLESDRDVHQYQSAEYQFLGFDELTSFSEYQYRYMLSRLRSSIGLPVQVRSGTNPGNKGHEWVMRRWGPWLDPEFEIPGLPPRLSPTGARLPPAAPGEVMFYRNTHDGELWVPPGTRGALTRVFVPAFIDDNPHLADNDPDYKNRLAGLDLVTREQLLGGNWLIKPAPGLYFQRGYFPIVEAAPAEVMTIRYWDRAATEVSRESPDPDWTVGVKLSLDRAGVYYVEHAHRLRQKPGKVVDAVKATAHLDGGGVAVGIERDPGQAGKFEAGTYVVELAGFNVHVYPVVADKVTRARPASAQAEAGNFRMLKGQWNEPFISCLEGFPGAAHDDDVDALSGAFNALTLAAHRCGWVKSLRPKA